MSIENKISERRKQLDMTQQQLAKPAEISLLLEEEDGLEKKWQLSDRLFSEDNMYTFVKATAAAKNMTQTSWALNFMKEKHKGQFRKGKDKVPYISHPLTMACHAFALGIEEDDILAAILLHDVIEDCQVLPEELKVDSQVTEAVLLLSFPEIDKKLKEKVKGEYFRGIAQNRIASIVKLLDRCNNISTMAIGFSKRKMIEYIDETEQYIFPILDTVKQEYPEFYNAAFLLKYQMKSVIETLKRIL